MLQTIKDASAAPVPRRPRAATPHRGDLYCARVRVTRGDTTVDVHVELQKMLAGKMSSEEWRAWCAAHGLTGKRLSVVG
jgi:hypothetical protein